MQTLEIKTIYIIIVLMFTSAFAKPISSQEESLPYWNENWSFRQEIKLPISTNESHAKYQPIDVNIKFINPCWTRNVNETSIRVCCWNGKEWKELESQIYNLRAKKGSPDYINECNLVFLVPENADGNERYYVYYHDEEKPRCSYRDHVDIEDLYYYDVPVSDISTEAKYYGIREEGYLIYGVGQEGRLLNRAFSQVVVKQKQGMKGFDILNADQIVSFAFSYYYGDDEKDESSSDQSFVHKKVFVDGNLMVEFGIVSESNKKDIRTTAIYKYYYSPLEMKRICVRVKHEVLKESVVKGKENIDGRYGAMFSLRTRSAAFEKMNSGVIYPYLYFHGEDGNIKEYKMNPDPESKNREWIISFKNDADLGKEAWIAYGEGENGKTHSIIFSSVDVVKSGTSERDGIQLKVAEKEYFDFLGTEIDYASINFGRNSYEKGENHDLYIPGDFEVEFDAELFTVEDGGYELVQKESSIYKELVKHRYLSEDPSFEKEKHDLTVVTYFGKGLFSYPWLANRTAGRLPVTWIELYRDRELISSGVVDRSFLVWAYKTFTGLVEGDYLVKVYWKFNDKIRFFNGAKAVTLKEDTLIRVFCTWERTVVLTTFDQNGKGVKDVHAVLLNKDGFVFDDSFSDISGKATLKAPYSLDAYILKVIYKDVVIYEGEIKKSIRRTKVDLLIELYDLTVEVKDSFDLPPGVEITPILLRFNDNIKFTPEGTSNGRFFFEDILPGDYWLRITYADFVDEKHLNLPEDGDLASIRFTATFDLKIELFDSRGNPFINENMDFKVLRDGREVYESGDTVFSLPPASYTIEAYHDKTLVGVKEVELTHTRNVKIVTTLTSIFPAVVMSLSFVFIGAVLALTLMKRLTLSSLLVFLAIAIVAFGLFQPWWELTGEHAGAERATCMFVNPQVMIESITYDGKTVLDVAEMPEIFVETLGKIVAITYAACISLGLAFILNKIGRKQLSVLLELVGVILLTAAVSMFYLGTAKLCEASIGVVQGEDLLSVSINEETVQMLSRWGFSSGFYLIIASAVLALFSFILNLRCFFQKKKP